MFERAVGRPNLRASDVVLYTILADREFYFCLIIVKQLEASSIAN